MTYTATYKGWEYIDRRGMTERMVVLDSLRDSKTNRILHETVIAKYNNCLGSLALFHGAQITIDGNIEYNMDSKSVELMYPRNVKKIINKTNRKIKVIKRGN